MNARKLMLTSLAALILSAGAMADSTWPENGTSLFADHKAFRIGDVVTILVAETARASNSADTSLSKSTATEAEIETVTLPSPTGSGVTTLLNGEKPAVKWDSTRTFDGTGSHAVAGSMETQLTAIVVDVLPNGNLVVEGSRLQQSQDDKVLIRISGILRPVDIGPDNRVSSTALAQAKVILENQGPIARSSERGLLNRLVDFIWPF